MLQHLFAAGRWIVVTWLLAVAAVRIARALVPGSRRVPPLETFVVGALLMTGAVAVAGSAGLLSNLALTAIAVALFLATLPLRQAATVRSARRRGRLAPIVAALPLLIDLPLYLATPPTNWDAMTYHLFLPARWIQEGRIFHVPTVFSDNAAAYAPQNGALLFGWSMSLLRSDVLCNVLQWSAVAAIAVALLRLARSLGVPRRAAALAAASIFWVQPIRAHAASANVDVWMLAFFAAALVWMVAYLRRPDRRTVLLCGLAVGLMAGTKTVGLSLALAVGLPAIVIGAWRRRPFDVTLFAAGALAGGGWWYARNLVRYGNPLFPLEVGPFAGAYDVDAVRAGEFHLDTVAAVGRVFERWGPLLCAMLVAGIVALLIEAVLLWRRGRARRATGAALLAVLGAGWVPWFLFVVPHNNQTRFLLPALLCALVGWGTILGRIARKNGKAATATALAVVAALAVTGRPDTDWGAHYRALRDAGASLAPVVAGLSIVVLGAFLARRRAFRGIALAVSLLGGLAALAFGLQDAEETRVTAYGRTAYRSWAEGFVPFHNAELEPQRIAYSGANIPYTLAGPRFRHTVVYCNTQGQAGDGFYQHWRRDPRVHDYHKPGVYRGPDDSYDTWLANLREREIDMLVLFSLHRAERGYLPITESGFPIEQRWVAEHPERFETLHRGRFAEIHRLVP